MRENNNNNNRRPENRNIRPGQSTNQRSQSSQSRSYHNLLPSPRVLESYEDIAPGSVNKLLELAKKEQDHRHSWQDKYLKFHNFSYKTGLVFGFVYNVALLFLIFNLVKQGDKSLALKLFVINTFLIIFAIIVTAVERKITTRKPPRRMNHNNKDLTNSSKPNPKTPSKTN